VCTALAGTRLRPTPTLLPLQYHVPFYLTYLARWPDFCVVQENPTGRVMSYSASRRPALRVVDLSTLPSPAVLGKAEGRGTDWHGHVSAVTVAPEFRRLGLARTLMAELERVSHNMLVQAMNSGISVLPHYEAPLSPCSYKGFFVDLFVRVSNTLGESRESSS
jgi:N-terminal acetyltransferase B complex catalytic subunit